MEKDYTDFMHRNVEMKRKDFSFDQVWYGNWSLKVSLRSQVAMK